MNLTIQSVCHISKDAAVAVAAADDDGDDNGLLIIQGPKYFCVVTIS